MATTSQTMPSYPQPLPQTDFSFNFDDPTLFPGGMPPFPPPPPMDLDLGMSNADQEGLLLSTAEANSIFGFLDNFEWDFDPMLPPNLPVFSPPSLEQVHLTHPPTQPPSLILSASSPSSSSSPPEPSYQEPRSPTAAGKSLYTSTPHSEPVPSPSQSQSRSRSSRGEPSPPPTSPPHHATYQTPRACKQLLSSPQKRLNHILSEQKRRNAIRDGYATLTNMLAPAGTPIGTGVPTRGRPKGSGRQGNGGAKGKSGVLFRAVEYCKWLEEGCEALRREVERMEIAAGITGVL